MNEHTPGPWYSSPICKGEWDNDFATVGPFPTGEGTDRPLGEVHHESTIAEVWGDNHDCAANAALIAAAPELLEACKVFAEWLRREDEGPLYPEGTTRDSPGNEARWSAWWHGNLELCDRAQAMAREAIEKATTPEARRFAEAMNPVF